MSLRFPSVPHVEAPPSPQEAAFLRNLQERCYRFFAEQSDPSTGLVSDRAPTSGGHGSDHASIAACGFGLAGHVVAYDAEWITRDQARFTCR
ncbi:MAG: hypothetical protein AAGA03_13335, partial [Planctomycetota bacterium]